MNILKILSAILVVTCVFFSATTTARAAPEKFSFDKNNTYVGFEVGYLFLMRVTGHFNDFDGALIIDRNRSENSRADLVIETASVDTGDESRNKDIRGPALFDTDQYPEMIYHSDTIEMGSGNKGTIIGHLTLLGVTRPVTMDLVRIPDAETQETGNEKSFSDGFMAKGKIRRSDFGMNDSSWSIGNEVTLFVCYKIRKCNDVYRQEKEIKPQYN